MQAQGGGGASRSWLAWVAVAALALIGVQAARSALVAAEGERRPELALKAWPGHPVPLRTIALRDIGTAAARGQAPAPATLAMIERSANGAPLAAEPLLVAATERLTAGDMAGGRRLLEAALRRDPRSTAAHFMLADLAIRQQRLGDALVHVTVLQRRLKGGVDGFAGALAEFAKQPGALAQLAPVLGSQPSLRRAMLSRLASDPGGEAALRALVRRGDAAEQWFVDAVRMRAASGDVAGVRALMTAAGQPLGGQRLAAWTGGAATTPFGWIFVSGAEGTAEPVLNGPLRLIYYGRADTVLAAHPLLLPPGRYALDSTMAGNPPAGRFEWRLICHPGSRVIATEPVNAGAQRLSITVGPDCPSQRLELHGRMGDFPGTVSAELQRVALVPVGEGS